MGLLANGIIEGACEGGGGGCSGGTGAAASDLKKEEIDGGARNADDTVEEARNAAHGPRRQAHRRSVVSHSGNA